MDGNRRWLGWIAIGLGALALLVALGGRGFGPQGTAAALIGANMPQSYAQQDARPQGAGPQRGGVASGPDVWREVGRPGHGGFGLGGWFRSPFKLLGGLFHIGTLALLVVLGVLLIRGRAAGDAAGRGPAEPAHEAAPEPQESTDVSYPDEPRNRE